MSSNNTISTLQTHHVKNLILILRRANAHYSAIAARVRVSLRPTHHARNRAAKLGLGVDVQKAVRLDHRQVSVVPLPIIEQVISPSAPAPSTQRPVLKCVIPAAAASAGTPKVTTAVVTQVLQSRNKHWSGPTSVLSATSADFELLTPLELTPILSDEEDTLEHDVPPSSDSEQDFIRMTPASYLDQDPDAPVDEVAGDWDLESDEDELSSSSSSSSLGPYCNPTSSGSISGSSSCLLTPELNDHTPLMIRIKRKSTEIRDATEIFEKRPKFERKEWLIPASERQPTVKIPAMRIWPAL